MCLDMLQYNFVLPIAWLKNELRMKKEMKEESSKLSNQCFIMFQTEIQETRFATTDC